MYNYVYDLAQFLKFRNCANTQKYIFVNYCPFA